MKYQGRRANREGQTLAAVLGIVVAVFVAVFLVHLMQQHDNAMDAAYATYTDCVQAQYGVSPTDYYQQHGVAATCN